MEQQVIPLYAGITEQELRFATAYFEISLDARHDHNVHLLAYRRAFPLSSDRPNLSNQAQRYRDNPRVRAMVDHLRQELAERSLVPAARVAQEIERVAFQNIYDFGSVDAEGMFYIDLSETTAEQAAAVAEIRTTVIETPSGVVTKKVHLKFYSKMDALDKLSRIHGLYMDKGGLTVDDIDRVIAAMERRLGNTAKVIEQVEA